MAPFFIEKIRRPWLNFYMSALLYFTDMHNGSDFSSPDEAAGSTRGSQAHALLHTILDYAAAHGTMPVIHGGDENNIACPQDVFERNVVATDLILSGYAGHMLRASGNHDPHHESKWAVSGIPEKSFAARLDNAVTAIVLQPKIYANPARPGQGIFYYDATDEALVKQTLAERPDDFMIVVSHWGLDRLSRGYPALYNKNPFYGYEIRTAQILDALEQRPAGSVINLAGHEHRFTFNAQAKVPTLILPALTQIDVDNSARACGLFSVLHIDKTGTGLYNLSIHYKRALADGTCTDVDPAYMQRYYRAVKPMLAAA